MFEELSVAEIDHQHLELLPARTVMSMFTTEAGGEGAVATGTGEQAKDPFAFIVAIFKDVPLAGKLLGGK